jgi:hypothetical protein
MTVGSIDEVAAGDVDAIAPALSVVGGVAAGAVVVVGAEV